MLEAVIEGHIDRAMLPIENTTAGSVYESYDLLLRFNLALVGEEIVDVRHCLLGVADIPIIQMSVRWWRTLHPQPIVFRPDPALPNEMLLVLLIGFVAILALATWLISLQTDTERAAQRISALRAEVDHREIA